MSPANDGVPENFLARDWRPRGVDVERASVARMYDYYLGGSYNFEVDRQAAEAVR
jgi:hypothetical protein